MFLPLAHISMLRNWCGGGWVFVFGWGGVGCGGVVGMLTFVALAHIFNSTQHDVSSTCIPLECYATWCFFHLHISRCYATDVRGLGVWQMTYWNIKHFLIKRNFFDKNEKTEFRKILTDKFAFTNLIYNGHHFKWQCIISKTKLSTCAAIEGRCTLVYPIHPHVVNRILLPLWQPCWASPNSCWMIPADDVPAQLGWLPSNLLGGSLSTDDLAATREIMSFFFHHQFGLE